MNFDVPIKPTDNKNTYERYGFLVKSESGRIVIEHAKRLKETKNLISDEVNNIIKKENKITDQDLIDLIAIETTAKVMKIGKKKLKPAEFSDLAKGAVHSGGHAYAEWEKKWDK
jgi:Ser-tRNA(Ala) deacylase AlaX